MNILKGIYDANSKRLMIIYKNNLLEDSLDLFKASIDEGINSKDLPVGTTIQSTDKNKVMIILPVELNLKLRDGDRIDPSVIPDKLTDKINDLINKFRNDAKKEKFGKTEFIPLNGYPLEDLKKDVKSAIKGKRNFCIIDEFKDLDPFLREKVPSIKQLDFKYLGNEYCDIALDIYEGKLEKLKKDLKDKLVEKELE